MVESALLLLAILMAVLVIVPYFVHLHNKRPSDIPIARESEGTDYSSRVNDLQYGDISENFSAAIHPDVPDETYSDTVIREEDKGEFSKEGVFAVSEEELEVIRRRPRPSPHWNGGSHGSSTIRNQAR